MRSRQLLVAVLFLGISKIAFAQSGEMSADSVLGMIQQAMAPAINQLTAQAISWVGVFASLQFFITNYNHLKSDGDIQSAVAKVAGAVAWVAVCVYIINNGPQFIQAVGDQMMGLLGTDLPSPGSIIAKTIGVTAVMAFLALGIGSLPFVGDTAGLLLVLVTLIILGVGLLFAFKIFMLQLELGLISMLSPLSFSFLGLNTLKDQGIAPFKALLSFAYRVILLGVILSGFNQVSDIVSSTLSGISVDTFQSTGVKAVVRVMLSALGAYLLLGYLTWKSDAIAATMASGSTSMGTGDVAQAAAAGAALGAAAATGGAAAASLAGKAPKSMSSFLDKLMAPGSVSNASPMGNGGDAPKFTPPSTAPTLSVGAPVGAGSAGAPQPPGRPAAGAASGPKKPNVASGRYGADAQKGGTASAVRQGAGPAAGTGSPQQGGATSAKDAAQDGGDASATTAAGMAQQGGAANGPSAVQDGGTATSASSSATGAPSKTQVPATEKAGSETAAAVDPVTVTPAGSQPEAAGAPGEAAKAGAEPQPGSALSAGIGGKSTLEDSLNKLVDHLSSQQQGPRKPTLGERLGEANRHMSQESAATHVSINAHHSD